MQWCTGVEIYICFGNWLWWITAWNNSSYFSIDPSLCCPISLRHLILICWASPWLVNLSRKGQCYQIWFPLFIYHVASFTKFQAHLRCDLCIWIYICWHLFISCWTVSSTQPIHDRFVKIFVLFLSLTLWLLLG